MFYSKGKNYTFNLQFSEYSDESKKLVNNRNGKSIDGKDRDINRGCHMNDWWQDINSLQTWSPERVKYPTQKPLKLIERIIKSSSNEDDLVADFYLGSGTTAVACKNLNRNFIGCDISETAIKISKERLS